MIYLTVLLPFFKNSSSKLFHYFFQVFNFTFKLRAVSFCLTFSVSMNLGQTFTNCSLEGVFLREGMFVDCMPNALVGGLDLMWMPGTALPGCVGNYHLSRRWGWRDGG